MKVSALLDSVHLQTKSNKWMNYFAVFLRVALALGFITSGMVKITGERFAAGLSVNHPMGQYLEALHNTGFYYTFIGIVQVIASILLLIPRTMTLGALLYFPIILNICVLSYAVRFEGSTLTSPLMALACLFIIFWNYDKIKYILPLDHRVAPQLISTPKIMSNTFPAKFFLGVLATIVSIILFLLFGFEIAPRNNIHDCNSQFKGTNRTQAGSVFCNGIHQQGRPLDSCIMQFDNAPNDVKVKK